MCKKTIYLASFILAMSLVLQSTGEADYIVVDDFEAYDADPIEDQIWYSWKDGVGYGPIPFYPGNGTGAHVGDEYTASYTEEVIVHGGGQSMPYDYINDGSTRRALYSESERTFEPAQNWSAEGITALSLWFYGEPNNDTGVTEQMYVKVNGSKVLYDGDMNNIRLTEWQEWIIDLTEFGVDLTNVTTLAIGFGDENNMTPAGTGKVYFDDIRLYTCYECEIELDKTASFEGDEITYVIDYNNLGATIDDVSIIDYLPEEVVYLTSDPHGSYNSNPRTVTWYIGTVPPGQANSVTLTVKIPYESITGSDIITNLCEIKSGDIILNTSCVNTPLPYASNPNPPHEATDVPPDTHLSWTPGPYVGTLSPRHKLFLSKDFNDVKEGTAAFVEQDSNSYDPPGLLDWATTYYWRIDEANSTTGWDQGNVWRFTTEPNNRILDANSIDVNASSEYDINRAAENTINGSGLDANDGHSVSNYDMWLSDSEPTGATIEYEFDKIYKLHQMWVWNFNDMFNNHFGVKDVSISYSTNGIDYTTLGSYQFDQAEGITGYEHETEIDFSGKAAKYVRISASSNWGGSTRYGLSEVRFYYLPGPAIFPRPADNATDVPVDTTLSWTPVQGSVSHHVYFGTDVDDVNNANATSHPNVEFTITDVNSYDPGILEFNTTYYWRIDETNDVNLWRGNVWSFTTGNYLVVDDFEDYEDDPPEDAIWYTWKDGIGYGGPNHPPYYPGNGTGSAVGEDMLCWVEETIVHNGAQSMPYSYTNDGSTGKALYSKAERIFDSAQDWTAAGVRVLSLWFYGDPSNDANSTEQMYAKVNGGKVLYNGDMDDIKVTESQEWNIDLEEFGVGLTSVTTLVIGFGDENNMTPAGTGKVYFDDIRLYQPKCVPALLKPPADFTNDCVVDNLDLKVMADEWLAIGPELEADLYLDNNVDLRDFAILAEQWLEELLWPLD